MDNQQGGTNPQGGDNNPQGSGNGPQGGDNAQANNYEYGQNMGGSQPYYNPYLQNQQPPQEQVPQEQVPQSQSPQSPVPQNQPQPNPYLNQQTPPPAPQVPPQPTQPLQPMGAPSGYAPQQGQQPQQPSAQPGGPQYYQYPQNDYGAGYPNQPGAGHMAGQPMPRKKSNAGAIVVVVLLVAVLGLLAMLKILSALVDAGTTASTERACPSSRVLPTSPHMRVPSTPMPSRTTAPTRGDTPPTVIADDVRAVLPANIANLVIGESCEEDVFSLDDVTPEKLCQLNTDGNSEYANYLGVVTDRTVIADVRRYGDFEEWKSIESAPGHTLKLGFTGPQERVGDSTVFFDFVNSNTLVTYRMLGNEDAVSQYLVDLGLAQFRDKA